MTCFEFIREVAARLRNDLDAALYKPLPLPVSLKNIERYIPHYGMNAFNGLVMSVRRGMRERAATRTRVWRFLQSAAAGSCAGCHAS